MATVAGSGRSWVALGGLAVGALVWQAACGPKAGDTGLAAATTDLLGSVGPSVVLPALRAFEGDAASLESAVRAWQSALAAGGDGVAERVEAQVAWDEAMMSWQQLEVMQIGPAGSSLTAVGGEDLRDEIYSWPTTNPCRVDQETASGGYAESDFFTTNLVNTYGLDTLEHLLHSGADNVCPGQVDINADGLWADLGDDGVAVARADYAAVVVAGVADQAVALRQAWDPDGGDFSGKLALTTGGSPYGSEQEALNAVFDALFYLESSTKDRKLATPMGNGDCVEDACPDDTELWASGTSLLAIEANLVGFRLLFTGGEDGGFDDRLDAAGHGDLGVEIVARTDAALSRVRVLQGPLSEAVVDRPADVQALHDDVKAVADLLKGDLATVMVLEIPSEAAGDND